MGQDEGWSHGKADFGEGVENLLVLYRLDEGQGGFPSWVGGMIMVIMHDADKETEISRF